METIDRMTLRECAFIMKAVERRMVDEVQNMHLQAWLNLRVGDTEKEGKNQRYKYKTFNQFFDRSKLEKGKKSRKVNSKLMQLIMKANSSE